MDNPSTVPPDDAQRDLERRALRNVRSLVDKLEGAERRGAEQNLRLVALVLAGMAALVALGALAVWVLRGPVQTHSVTIVPAAQGEGAPR